MGKFDHNLTSRRHWNHGFYRGIIPSRTIQVSVQYYFIYPDHISSINGGVFHGKIKEDHKYIYIYVYSPYGSMATVSEGTANPRVTSSYPSHTSFQKLRLDP